MLSFIRVSRISNVTEYTNKGENWSRVSVGGSGIYKRQKPQNKFKNE